MTYNKEQPSEEFDFVKMFNLAPSRMVDWNQEDEQTKKLLEKFKPKIYVSENSYMPMDFYGEYLRDSLLVKDGKNLELDSMDITSNKIKKYEKDSSYYIDYQIPYKEILDGKHEFNSKVYGRIYEDYLVFDNKETPLLFLKYNLVYPYSGLPQKVGFIKGFASKLIGNPKAWHELDIHGAIHVVLNKNTEEPIGVVLAQHNHHQVLLNEIDFVWPKDNRIVISISELSNEPYLIYDGKEKRLERTVGNPMDIRYLRYRTDSIPITGGLDLIPGTGEGTIKVDSELIQLEPNDPLYTTEMLLGERKKLFGLFNLFYLNGPPGMDYYTFPEMKNLADLMAFWYIDNNDEEFFELFEKNMKSFSEMNIKPVLSHQKKRLINILNN